MASQVAAHAANQDGWDDWRRARHASVLGSPTHPYTRRLIGGVPRLPVGERDA